MEQKISLDLGAGVCLSYTNKEISIVTPERNTYCLIDIAKGLAYKCRFAGQMPFYYSIADHSILVDDLLVIHEENVTREKRLACILHDASEAYMCDMPTPFKRLMPDFKLFEDGMQRSIYAQFGLDYNLMNIVKKYDRMALEIEFGMIKNTGEILQSTPEQSVEMFIERFWNIINL